MSVKLRDEEYLWVSAAINNTFSITKINKFFFGKKEGPPDCRVMLLCIKHYKETKFYWL